MDERLKSYPERVVPYIVQSQLNQPVLAAKGPFRLNTPKDITLYADLMFRWLPGTAVGFDGTLSEDLNDLEAEFSLEAEGNSPFRAPFRITHMTISREPTRIAGVLQEPLSIGDSSFEALRFSLSNFPDFLGAPVRYECNDNHGLILGRLELPSAHGSCQLDVVPEADGLRKQARQDAGFVISHVGQWLPTEGELTLEGAQEVLEMLRVWFGFLRGAWAGPLFPQGLRRGEVVWQQFAAWTVQESRSVTTWLPQRKPADLSNAFSGFSRLWSDSAWKGPLKLAVSWLVEANGSRTGVEAKIILAQVALELLATVHLVETQSLYSRNALKGMSAAERIRMLLKHLDIPAAIPGHLTNLAAAFHPSGSDGPSVITTIRNKLAHSAEGNSAIKALGGDHLFECSQLALQYVELSLLSIFGHDGYYARRAWQGWKGDDEVLVPWC